MLGGIRRPGSNSNQRDSEQTLKAMNAEDIRQNTEDGFDATVDQFESARDRVQDAFEQGKEQLVELQKQALQCTREAAESADKFVKDKPWQAIGIAAAVGLVAGLLIRRR